MKKPFLHLGASSIHTYPTYESLKSANQCLLHLSQPIAQSLLRDVCHCGQFFAKFYKIRR